jgi:recombination protein U
MPGGRELEKRANKLNLKKRLNKEALILQIPVPIIMTKNGIVPKQSTVDFAGLIKGGKFIAFDAKETKVKTRFDLSNIHQHQLEYLMMVRELGGLAFFLI